MWALDLVSLRRWRRGAMYTEAGAGYYERRDARNHDHLVRHHQQALARLSYQVTLIPAR